MIKGSHNSATGHRLLGWQKYFSWIINLVCRCQKKTLEQQIKEGVRVFDIQVNKKNGKWLGSHGIAWYDIEPLEELQKLAAAYGITVFVLLGLDNHFMHNCNKSDFVNLIKEVNGGKYPNIRCMQAYTEKPYFIMHTSQFMSQCISYYWTTTWAKAARKHWYQLWYYLPIPILWKKIYGKKWDAIAASYRKLYYITDFV